MLPAAVTDAIARGVLWYRQAGQPRSALVSVTTAAGLDSLTLSGAPHEWLAAFAEWLDDAARPWYGLTVWTWAAAVDASGALTLTLQADDAFTLASGDAMAAVLGLPDVTLQTETAGLVPGLWVPRSGVSLRQWVQALEEGQISGTGATRPGVPVTAGLRPDVRAAATPGELARLGQWSRAGGTPRIVWLYTLPDLTWRQCGVTMHTADRVDSLLWSVRVPVYGYGVALGGGV